jgi:hypothetical protein
LTQIGFGSIIHISQQGVDMKLTTAISVLQKDADFLGMNFLDFLKFVKTNPMAQTQKTMEAYRVFAAEATAFFA